MSGSSRLDSLHLATSPADMQAMFYDVVKYLEKVSTYSLHLLFIKRSY